MLRPRSQLRTHTLRATPRRPRLRRLTCPLLSRTRALVPLWPCLQHETASPDQRLFSLTGSATTLGTTNTYFLAVLESQPYGARLLELRNLAPAFTEAARFECAPGIDCSPLDLRTARVDVLSSAWAVAAGLVPAGSGAQLLTSLARVGGVWHPGKPVAVPATELAGVQGTPPWPYLFTVATRDLGVVYANGGAFPPPQ